jgi:YtfJ family uncharacterized protein
MPTPSIFHFAFTSTSLVIAVLMNTIQKLYLLLLIPMLTIGALPVFAIGVGEPLPILEITSGGALVFDKDGQLEYQPWSTESLAGKMRIIQYLPGRNSEGKENLALNEAVFRIDHPERCRTTSIVNYTDAIWGTHFFIESPMKRNKLLMPLCDVVLDEEGKGLEIWKLQPKQNITIIIDEAGIIRFFHAGKLRKKQIREIVEMTNPPGIDARKPNSAEIPAFPAQ